MELVVRETVAILTVIDISVIEVVVMVSLVLAIVMMVTLVIDHLVKFFLFVFYFPLCFIDNSRVIKKLVTI